MSKACQNTGKIKEFLIDVSRDANANVPWNTEISPLFTHTIKSLLYISRQQRWVICHNFNTFIIYDMISAPRRSKMAHFIAFLTKQYIFWAWQIRMDLLIVLFKCVIFIYWIKCYLMQRWLIKFRMALVITEAKIKL